MFKLVIQYKQVCLQVSALFQSIWADVTRFAAPCTKFSGTEMMQLLITAQIAWQSVPLFSFDLILLVVCPGITGFSEVICFFWKLKKKCFDLSFLVQGAVRIRVSVPMVEGESNFRGQTLELTVLSLSESIKSLKERIAGEVQLPANKQKLSSQAGFLKDNLSLAYYNIGPGDILTLGLKERGGRR